MIMIWAMFRGYFSRHRAIELKKSILSALYDFDSSLYDYDKMPSHVNQFPSFHVYR